MLAFRTKARHAFTVLSNKSSTPLSPATELSDMRLSPRCLDLLETSPVAFGALQYFYTLSLCTPLQHQTNVLIGLLFFARTYDIPNLRALVVHALHGAISQGAGVAASVYEACTLGTFTFESKIGS